MLPGTRTAVEPRPAWQWGGGAVLLGVFGWFAFVRGTRVPLLGWIDLAIHEFGHLATVFLPEVVSAMMGNGTQTLLPLGLAAVFGFRERNWLGVVFCLGWAATTLQDASIYIADAPYQRLQLIGGYHDWAFALTQLDRLHQAETIAQLVWTAGLMLWIVAAVGCATGPWIERAITRAPALSPATSPAVAPSAAATDTRVAPQTRPATSQPDVTGQPRGSPDPDAPSTGPDPDWRGYFG